MSKSRLFFATSAKGILNFFDVGIKANYAYAVMAQPVIDINHSFCVSIFGTDNRFECEDVLKRWQKMKQLADIEGIHILGFSSDADTRILKAMEISCNEQISLDSDSNQIEKNSNDRSWTWYHMGQNNSFNEGQICIQDSIHIATKLRTRLLNRKITLIIGKHVATVEHLYTLISEKNKRQT